MRTRVTVHRGTTPPPLVVPVGAHVEIDGGVYVLACTAPGKARLINVRDGGHWNGNVDTTADYTVTYDVLVAHITDPIKNVPWAFLNRGDSFTVEIT